jgi:hypothetical protein
MQAAASWIRERVRRSKWLFVRGREGYEFSRTRDRKKLKMQRNEMLLLQALESRDVVDVEFNWPLTFVVAKAELLKKPVAWPPNNRPACLNDLDLTSSSDNPQSYQLSPPPTSESARRAFKMSGRQARLAISINFAPVLRANADQWLRQVQSNHSDRYSSSASRYPTGSGDWKQFGASIICEFLYRSKMQGV